jgi:hypothetical protein
MILFDFFAARSQNDSGSMTVPILTSWHPGEVSDGEDVVVGIVEEDEQVVMGRDDDRTEDVEAGDEREAEF